MNKAWFILGCLLFFVLFVVQCADPKSQAIEGEQTWLNHHDSVAYVGMEACRACHGDKFETFSETGMGQSFGFATRDKSKGVFHQLHPVYDKVSNFYYLPTWRNDSLFVLEFRLSPQKDTLYKREEYIQYIIGSGQHTNSHLINLNGFIYQAPLTWYAQKKIWDFPPGYENGNNSRFSRLINEECMSCHNAMPGFDFSSDNRFTNVPHGIDCERCHGPGELHVQQKKAGILVDVSKGADYTIVNPRRLSWELQVDACQRCHLQGNAVLEPGKSFLDFKPGMRLSSIMSIFMPLYEGEEPGFIMASHAQRLQKSACFIKSNNQSNNLEFTCITCHNPHVSVAKTRIEVFNNACANCHVQNTCSEIPEKLKMANNNCVSCHMPANTPSDIPHVTIHDHYIRKPILNKESTGKKRLIGLYSVNNPNPNNALKIKAYLSQYEKFERDNLLFLDSAEKLLIAGGRDNLEEWIRFVYLRNDYAALVQIAQSYSGKDAWTWYRIARANLLLNNLENALSAIKKAVDYKTNSLDFQNEYALILIQKKMFNQAIVVLNSLLTLQPKQARALTNRGFAFEQIGKTTLAVSDYKAALALDPDHGQARSNLKRLANQGFK